MAFFRLDRLVSDSGLCTRSEARKLIKSGAVSVGGEVRTRPEERFDEGAELTVNGEPTFRKSFRYIMMNKPAGVLSATEDRRDTTALDLLPEKYRRLGLSPAGRLDKDAEGLLILTDDGPLIHAIISPRRHVDKVYEVLLANPLRGDEAAAFAAGVTLDDGYCCMPALLVPRGERQAIVTLREGKFHQLKRMFTATGNKVVYLKRISVAGVELDPALSPGEFRELTSDELFVILALK